MLAYCFTPGWLLTFWPWPVPIALGVIWLGYSKPPTLPLAALAVACVPAIASPAPAVAGAGLWWGLLGVMLLGAFQTMPRPELTNALLYAGAGHVIWLALGGGVGGKPGGWWGNPNLAAAVFALLLPLALARRRWLFVALFTLGLGVTRSVGALAGTMIALIASWGVLRGIFKKWHYLSWGVVSAGVAAVLAGIYPALAPLDFWRLRLWGFAVQLGAESPLIGQGVGAYAALWPGAGVLPFPPAGIGYYASWRGPYWPAFTHAHSVPLHLWAEGGIVGLVALGLLGVAVLAVQGPASYSLLALGVHNLIDATLLHPGIMILAAAVTALGLPQQKHNSPGLVLGLLLVLGLGGLGAGLWLGALY